MTHQRWALLALAFFATGCSQSTPLLIAEHDGHYVSRFQVGVIDAAGEQVKLNESGRALKVHQVAAIRSVLPVYRAVVGSSFLKAKATRVRRVVLDEWNGTLELQLRNSEYFSVMYTPARSDDSSANRRFVTTAEGNFQIWQSGVWLPGDR